MLFAVDEQLVAHVGGYGTTVLYNVLRVQAHMNLGTHLEPGHGRCGHAAHNHIQLHRLAGCRVRVGEQSMTHTCGMTHTKQRHSLGKHWRVRFVFRFDHLQISRRLGRAGDILYTTRIVAGVSGLRAYDDEYGLGVGDCQLFCNTRQPAISSH